MRFDSRLLAIAKDPEQSSAYQDAAAMDAEHGVAAIADGVSSAIFSGPWAEILTEAAVADNPDPDDQAAFAAWLHHCKKWPERIDTSALAWFQRAKLPAGAFSTCCGSRPRRAGSEPLGQLRRLPFPRPCDRRQLPVPLRGGELVRSFPMQKAAESGRPDRAGQRRLEARPVHAIRRAGRVFATPTTRLCCAPTPWRSGPCGGAGRRARPAKLGPLRGKCPTTTGTTEFSGFASNGR